MIVRIGRSLLQYSCGIILITITTIIGRTGGGCSSDIVGGCYNIHSFFFFIHSNHAWGGNYIVSGGNVDGGRILGEFPEDLSENCQHAKSAAVGTTTSPSCVFCIREQIHNLRVKGEHQSAAALHPPLHER